jgi:hypothetical protein
VVQCRWSGSIASQECDEVRAERSGERGVAVAG